MSSPEPMRCLLDECPSPMRCNDAGGCRETQKDAANCYALALSKCREQGVIPETWRPDHG